MRPLCADMDPLAIQTEAGVALTQPPGHHGSICWKCGAGTVPTQLRPPCCQGVCPHRSPQQNLSGRGVGPMAGATTAWAIDGAIAGGTWGMAWGHPAAGHSPGMV